MKSTLLASTLAVAGLCAAPAFADDEAPAAAEPKTGSTVELGIDFQSAYVATGATCNDGWMAMPWVAVYGLTVGETAIPLSCSFWGAIDLEPYPYNPNSKKGHFQEIDVDVTLDLGAIWKPCDEFSWSIGYLEYDYPSQGATRVDEEGNEVAGGNNTDHVLVYKMGYDYVVAPSFTAKYRIGGPSEGKLEAAFALSTGFDLTDDLAFGLSADVWYVNVDDVDGRSSDESGFACADVTAKLSCGPAYVGCTYVAQIDDDVLPDGPYGYDVKWYASFGFSKAF